MKPDAPPPRRRTRIGLVLAAGVLSALAVTALRTYDTRSPDHPEATHLLRAVRAAQESYFGAFGQYCGSATPEAWPPARPTSRGRLPWGAPPTRSAWAQLGLRSPGGGWFQYFVAAGKGGDEPADWPASIRNRGPWYLAWAENNFDGGSEETFYEVGSAGPLVYEGRREDSPNE